MADFNQAIKLCKYWKKQMNKRPEDEVKDRRFFLGAIEGVKVLHNITDEELL